MKKYLITLGTGIGDFFITLPLAKAIKEENSENYVVGFAASDAEHFKITKELFKIQNYYDEIFYYHKKEPLHTINFIIHVFSRRYDVGAVMQNGNITVSKWPCRIVNFLCKKTVGMTFPETPEIQYDLNLEYKKGKRKFEILKEIGQAIGVEVKDDVSNLVNFNFINNLSQSFRIRKKIGQRVIVLCVGTNKLKMIYQGHAFYYGVKRWEYHKWLSLAERLQSSGCLVILMGGNQEYQELKKLQNEMNVVLEKGAIDCVGKTTILETIAVLQQSDLIVGADTGLIYCAAALNKKSLTLFGPTASEEYLAFGTKSHYIASKIGCAPCYPSIDTIECKDCLCMKSITVEMVFDKAMDILNRDIIEKSDD